MVWYAKWLFLKGHRNHWEPHLSTAKMAKKCPRAQSPNQQHDANHCHLYAIDQSSRISSHDHCHDYYRYQYECHFDNDETNEIARHKEHWKRVIQISWHYCRRRCHHHHHLSLSLCFFDDWHLRVNGDHH